MYQDSDKDAVWKLHVDGLNQTGTFIFDPKLDSDFDDIKDIYIENGGEFLVATTDSTVIGMGALRRVDFDIAEIKRMRVDVNHQKLGVGSMILKNLIKRAVDLGYKKLILDTNEKQIAAKQLYKKFGFREYKRDKPGDYERIFYALDLNKMVNKTLKSFLLGSAFGLFFFDFFYEVSDYLIMWNSNLREFMNTLADILFFPAHLVRYTGWLHYLCKLFNSNACRGLGFDGGPLVWVEFVQMLAPVALLYGLLFVLIYKLVEKTKRF